MPREKKHKKEDAPADPPADDHEDAPADPPADDHEDAPAEPPADDHEDAPAEPAAEGGLRLYETLARQSNPKADPPKNMEAGMLVYLTDQQAEWGLKVGYLVERSLVFAADGDLTGTLPTTDMGTSEVVQAGGVRG